MDDARADIAERAKAIYEARLRSFAEAEHFGKIVSIDVNSGDYEIAMDREDRWPALHRLRDRHENPQVFTMRIGGGPVARIGGFRRVPGASA